MFWLSFIPYLFFGHYCSRFVHQQNQSFGVFIAMIVIMAVLSNTLQHIIGGNPGHVAEMILVVVATLHLKSRLHKEEVE